MVVGGCTLIVFALWECYAPLKEPLLPVHLFKHFPWVAACVNLGIGASIYYVSFSIPRFAIFANMS
jgi:hypothetical protein